MIPVKQKIKKIPLLISKDGESFYIYSPYVFLESDILRAKNRKYSFVIKKCFIQNIYECQVLTNDIFPVIFDDIAILIKYSKTKCRYTNREIVQKISIPITLMQIENNEENMAH